MAAGRLGIDEAIDRLRDRGVEDLGFARLDTDRESRTGMAEAIFAPGKTDEQLAVIVERCLDVHGKVLVTRLEEERATPLLERFEQLRYHAAGRILEARPDSEPDGISRRSRVSRHFRSAGGRRGCGRSRAPRTPGRSVQRYRRGGDSPPCSRSSNVSAPRPLWWSLRVWRVRCRRSSPGSWKARWSRYRPRSATAPASAGWPRCSGCSTRAPPGIGVVNIDNGFGAATLVHRMTRAGGGSAQ